MVSVASVKYWQMDKYVKIRKIGEGSFGSAFLVKEKDKGMQMVMKEINMMKVTYVTSMNYMHLWPALATHVRGINNNSNEAIRFVR